MKYRISWMNAQGARGIRIVFEEEAKELCNTLIVNRFTFSVEPEPVWH